MAFKQKGFNPGQGTGLSYSSAQKSSGSGAGEQYISGAAGFDPSGVAAELKNNPNAMIAEDLLRVKQGEFGRDASLQDKRDLYQTRAKKNYSDKIKARQGNLESWTYTDPRTGQQKSIKNPDYKAPVEQETPAEQSMQDVNVGGGGGVDWQKVDTARRQRAAETAKYGKTDRQARRFQRQQKRATNRMQRQQRRDARKLKRQQEGGFFRRLAGKIFG